MERREEHKRIKKMQRRIKEVRKQKEEGRNRGKGKPKQRG